MANRKGPTYKDVMFTAVTAGLSAVQTLAEDNELSRQVLEKACAGLAATGQDVTKFAAYIVETHGEKGERGVSAVENGETRTYKAQQVKDGAVHARIPLVTLGLEKGELADAVFCSGVEDIPSDLAGCEFIILRVGR